jgi:ribosomal protein L31
MKKVMIIMAVGTFGLVSCKKDWTCECEVNNTKLPTYTIKDKTLSDAKDQCNANFNIGSTKADCKVKVFK